MDEVGTTSFVIWKKMKIAKGEISGAEEKCLWGGGD